MTVTSFSPILSTLTTEIRSLHWHFTQGFNRATSLRTTCAQANVNLFLFWDFWGESSRQLGIGQSMVSVCRGVLNHEGVWHSGTTIKKYEIIQACSLASFQSLAFTPPSQTYVVPPTPITRYLLPTVSSQVKDKALDLFSGPTVPNALSSLKNKLVIIIKKIWHTRNRGAV